MANALSASVDDGVLRRHLLDKIDRARDVRMKAGLKRALGAAFAAYEEDKNELGLQQPSSNSLKGLLKFIAHPYRTEWMAPSLAINPEGKFVAIWDVVPNRYSVEFLDENSAEWIGVERSYDQVQPTRGRYSNLDNWQAPPFQIPRGTSS